MAGDKYSPSKEVDKTGNETILDIGERHYLFSCVKMSTLDKFSIFLAEVIGTGFLLFIGCSGGIAWNGPATNLYGSLTFGFALLFVISCIGTVSGAHLNPAVTAAAVAYRAISVPVAAIYIVAQLIGAFLGFGLLKLLTPTLIFRAENATGPGVCSTVPHPELSGFQAFAMEFFATMALVLLCCGVWDPRNANRQDSVAIKFGFTLAVLSMGIGPYTGCSMNPARSLAPALWNGDYDMHWIYWIAPILSGVLTALLYKALFWRDVPQKQQKLTEEFSLSLVQNKSS